MHICSKCFQIKPLMTPTKFHLPSNPLLYTIMYKLLLTTAIVLGFSSKSYNVSEGDGIATVTIVVTGGMSDIRTTAVVRYISNTATGKKAFHCVTHAVIMLSHKLSFCRLCSTSKSSRTLTGAIRTKCDRHNHQ